MNAQPPRLRRPWAPILTTIAAALLAGASVPAHAASLRVNSPNDLHDAAPGDGVCEASPGIADCTLRAAIDEANVLPGTDDISLSDGRYPIEIPGADEDANATGDFDITDSLVLTCEPGATCSVDAGRLDRAFHSIGSIVVTMLNITIENGSVMPGPTLSSGVGGLLLAEGGLVDIQGAVLRGGEAQLGGAMASLGGGLVQCRSAKISACSATSGGAGYESGSSLRVFSTSVEGCVARDVGGAFLLDGGSGAFGTDTIRGNLAQRGAGFFARSGASLSVEETLVDGNVANVGGGGLGIEGASVSLSGSRCENNSAPEGAGIALYAGVLDNLKSSVTSNNGVRGVGVWADAGSVNCLNSTIAFNKATGVGSRGGALMLTSSGLATATLAFTTIGNNTADEEAGGVLVDAGLVTLRNSIIAGNVALIAPDGRIPDGSMVSRGYNIFGDPSGFPVSALRPEDLIGVDPRLGGPTQGRGFSFGSSPMSGSPAIDGADPVDCTDLDGRVLGADQHGEVRPVDGDSDGVDRCDIGAIEWCGEDLDNNGVGDKCGCELGDVGSVQVPLEPLLRVDRIPGFRHPLLTWDDLATLAGPATTYEVAGGNLDDLWQLRIVDGPCLIVGLVDARWENVTPVAEDVYYLARGVNACGPPATQGWGKDSLGNPHLACP